MIRLTSYKLILIGLAIAALSGCSFNDWVNLYYNTNETFQRMEADGLKIHEGNSPVNFTGQYKQTRVAGTLYTEDEKQPLVQSVYLVVQESTEPDHVLIELYFINYQNIPGFALTCDAKVSGSDSLFSFASRVKEINSTNGLQEDNRLLISGKFNSDENSIESFQLAYVTRARGDFENSHYYTQGIFLDATGHSIPGIDPLF